MILAALVLAASAGGAIADETLPPAEAAKLGEFIPMAPPQPAPEISFSNGAGDTVALADFKGRFVLLNLWATWCEPCLREMPSLEALQAKLGPALIIVAVSEDRGGQAVVEPFVAKLGLDRVKIYLDPKSTASHAFAARGLPTSLVIDAAGRMLGRVEGAADWNSAEMLAVLRGLLPPETPDGGVKHAAR